MFDEAAEHAADGRSHSWDGGVRAPRYGAQGPGGVVVVSCMCTEIQGLSEGRDGVVGKAAACRTGDASHREEALPV